METFSRDRLLAHHGRRHVASEPHVRIEVLRLDGERFLRASSSRTDGLFDGYHGELLIICLAGACTVRTESQTAALREGDQVLLVDGEPFRVDRHTADAPAVVQLVWTPGPNPCRTCWEVDERFFGTR